MCSNSADIDECVASVNAGADSSENNDSPNRPCDEEEIIPKPSSDSDISSMSIDMVVAVSADDTAKPVEACTTGSSSYCRICQVGNEGSDEQLGTCRCQCKGHLARVHRSCLAEWVRYKGSNRCEICGGTFRDIPSPVGRLGVNQLDQAMPSPSPPDVFYFQALETLRVQLANYQPVTRRKRTAMAGVIVFLLLITGVTGILADGADREFHRINEDPWATEPEIRKSHILFSICISFLFFSVTLTLGLVILWLIVECYFYMQRRRILQHAAMTMMLEAGHSRRAHAYT